MKRPKKGTYSFTLTPTTKKELHRLAALQGISASSWIELQIRKASKELTVH